jgi:two-component system sensor histidine kinase FlrB
MLLFAKSGEQPVVSPCQIIAVLAEVRHGAEAMLVKHNASLKIELQERSLTVLGNQPALVGALQNLIHNALQVKPENANLLIKVYTDSKAQEKFVIDVVDDGPGVSAANISKIFEPFFTTKSQGTGLGLAVVSAVAKSHGGIATVVNNQNGGACFSLRLPKLEGQKPKVFQPKPFSKTLATNGENS